MPKLLDAIADHYLRPHGGAVRRGPTTGREGAAQACGIEPDATAKEGGRRRRASACGARSGPWA
jgi:hypothetical protein